MTPPATVTEPAAPAAPAPAAAPARRRGLGLGARIVVTTTVLIALAVGAAVASTVVIADRIARREATGALAATASLQEAFRARRDEQLALIAGLFVADPYLAAYVAEAVDAGDGASILDLMAERQAELGFDFAIVLDPAGRVVARTDRPGDAGGDLAGHPLVSRAREEYGASGIWWEGSVLYQAAAVPVVRGAQLVGFLVTGIALDDAAALEVKRMTGTEVAYLVPGRDGEAPQVVAATLDRDLEGRFATALAGLGGGLDASEGGELELTIAGAPWIARVAPMAAGGEAPSVAPAVAVALAPLAPRLAPFRQVVQVLVASGLLALLASVALSYAFARRTMGPVRELVAATAAARAGEYRRRPVPARQDEIGELATAFDDLLADLREKSDVEDYLAAISRSLPEAPSAAPLAATAASRAPATLLLAEWRRHVRGDGEAPQSLERFGEDLRRLVQACGDRGGHLEAVAGHRAWVRFAGDGASLRAFYSAAELLRAALAAGVGESELPVVALAAGDAVAGSVEAAGERRSALIGRPVQELEGLLREAMPGELVFGEEVEAEVGTTLEAAGQVPRRQAGVLRGRTFLALGAADAAALAVAAPTLAVPAATGRGPAAAAFAGIAPGRVLGDRFEVLSVLGSGGMGVVYKARDRELDEVVALKMLRPDRAGDATLVERLREELRLARRITHPNVLRTFDLGLVEGVPFITMEYVPGVTLERLLAHSGRLGLSAGLRVARQLCQALAAAHAVGVLHRDVKPPNLLVQPNGNLKLMDFGIARRIERLAPAMTTDGWVVGTPLYLAPEQLRGEEPDARTDLYACGVVFYEMFAGRPPWASSSHAELAARTLREVPAPPSQHAADLPPALEEIILGCLEKERDRRPAGAAALLAQLAQVRG
jgi:serine/threonine-protein kinase